jgi:hypothetical protein
MSIARLPSGGLWAWSPIRLDEHLRVDVGALGTPAHLVSPNPIYHLYLQDWKAAWPTAKLWGPLSTIKKRSDLSFEAPLQDDPPAEWAALLTRHGSMARCSWTTWCSYTSRHERPSLRI